LSTRSPASAGLDRALIPPGQRAQCRNQFRRVHHQNSRPPTIGYGLTDSPPLQLAWIAEKVHDWTDLPVDRDQVLTTVSLYWFSGSGGSAAHTLYEQAHSSDWGAPPAVPQGFAVFGADETVRRLVPAPPGAHWTEFPHAKHFPAMEAPADLAADLQAFFAPLP
jgi:epoxide hydrolase